jgi:hypothetical protein
MCIFFIWGTLGSRSHRGILLPTRWLLHPTPSEKDFSFKPTTPPFKPTTILLCRIGHHLMVSSVKKPPIITLQRLLTLTASMLHYKHNQRSWMPIISSQQVAYLDSLVKYKSHHKYHSPAHIKFKTYAEAKAYCLKHSLDHTSSWVLTTVNHCA